MEKKLRLDLDALEVETFDTTPEGAPVGRGTLFGQFQTGVCPQSTLNMNQNCTDGCTDYCTNGNGNGPDTSPTCNANCPSIMLTCQYNSCVCVQFTDIHQTQCAPGGCDTAGNYTCVSTCPC
jgi:hypothetical protein